MAPVAEVQEERLVGGDLFRVGDELVRLVDQIGGQVVALLRRLRRLDLMVVVDQIRVVLVGVAAEEAVEALEAAAQRPAVVGPAALICSAGVRCHLPIANVL